MCFRTGTGTGTDWALESVLLVGLHRARGLLFSGLQSLPLGIETNRLISCDFHLVQI